MISCALSPCLASLVQQARHTLPGLPFQAVAVAAEQRVSIDHLLNGPVPTPAPTPEPAPSPPPIPAPPPPAPWQTPALPSSGGTGSVTYTESALKRFAQTSDERASAFRQAHGQAGHIQVSRDAFGYMFGALVYSAYQRHVQSVTSGIESAGTAMSGIAAAMRDTADSVHADNQSIEHDLNQIGTGP